MNTHPITYRHCNNRLALKTFLLTLLCLTSVLTLKANDTFDQALEQYNNKNYTQAINLWQSLLDHGTKSAAIYYNLGNAYFRLDNKAQAALNYERALRLAPRDKDTQENLRLLYSLTEDHIEPLPQSFFANIGSMISRTATPRGWFNIILIIILITTTTIVVTFVAQNYNIRKWALGSSFAFVLALIIAIACATISAHRTSNSNEAIITAPSTIVRSAPGNNGVDKFILHEGTKVTIEEQQEEQIRITIADAKSGWIDLTDAETI